MWAQSTSDSTAMARRITSEVSAHISLNKMEINMHIFITGTSSGIGKAIATKFLAEGHTVTGFDKQEAAIEHPRYVHFVGDVRNKDSYPEVAPVDILVNNAGIQGDDDIAVNLKGVIDITEKYGIHESIKAVLMIGSAGAHSGAEFPEYVASKGGVISYTKNVALRIAQYGGTCNSLDFGGVVTDLNRPVMDDPKLWNQIMDLTPLRRWMSVEETADWAYFITVTNRFCTGQNILIDGLEYGNAHFVWPE